MPSSLKSSTRLLQKFSTFWKIYHMFDISRDAIHNQPNTKTHVGYNCINQTEQLAYCSQFTRWQVNP